MSLVLYTILVLWFISMYEVYITQDSVVIVFMALGILILQEICTLGDTHVIDQKKQNILNLRAIRSRNVETPPNSWF